VRKIVATVVLTLAALAGPGLTTAEAAAAAGAAAKAPGASGVSAWGRATQAPQLVRASLPGTSQASAISGAQLWARRYTGSGNGISNDDLARSVAVSPSGDTIFVTGFSTGDTQDYATVAYNAAAGAQLWLKRYNGPAAGDDEAYSVAVSPSGETVFVTGYSAGATSGDDYVTVAYDAATGAQLWARRYNGPGNGTDHARALAVSPRGDAVFVTGYSAGGTATGYDYATVAYNPATGAQLWLKRYNGPVNGDDAAASVTVSPGGDAVFATGYSDGGAPTGNDYATVAYNPATGAQLWLNRYNGGAANHGGEAVSVAVSPGGGTVYVTGFSPGATSGDDYVTAAYNAATGATVWVRRYNGSGNGTDDPVSVAVSPDGGAVYVTGRSSGGGPGGDYATVAYNPATGATLWVRRYDGPANGDDAAASVAVSPAGGTVYVTGYSTGATSGPDYVTAAYNAATGATLWVRRYDGPANSTDAAYSVAVSSSTGTVFVTGISYGATSGADYLTVAYGG